MMTTIADRIDAAKARITQAEKQAQRPLDSVQLLAVSKTKPASDLRLAFEAGQTQFGENYLQEALDKQQQLSDLNIQWHFIGPIQSNKTRSIAEHFDWVHSVERLKVAQRLSNQRPDSMAELNVCLQVNISGEASKSGVSADELLPLAKQVAELPHLTLRGLMVIPQATDNPEHQQQQFSEVKALFDQLKSEYDSVDTLSMGMSGDLEVAVEQGSTMVRIGTAIFGARNKREQ